MKERRKLRRYRATLDAEYTKVEGCVTIPSSSITTNISQGGLRATISRLARKAD